MTKLVKLGRVDSSLVEYHGRQFIKILTAFGWVLQRDDGVPFPDDATAIASVKPGDAPPPKEPETVEEKPPEPAKE